MLKLSVSTCGALLLAANVAAQTVVVPDPGVIAGGGSSANIWRAGINRVQCFYDSSSFLNQAIGQPITISGFEWRAIAAVAAPITYPSVEIYVQNAAVNYSTPSTTFASNRTVAFPTTPNYAGPVTVNAGAAGVYVINIPLTTTFNYFPDAGQDLLVEIVILANPAPLTGTSADCGFNNPAHLCNSIRSVGSTTVLTGTASAFCPIIRTTYSNIPGGASNTTLGVGCYQTARSLYELFPGSTADLGGNTITLTQNVNGGYTAVTTPGATLVMPTGVGLALTDDLMSAAQALPFTFDYPGGSTSSVFVDSNGSLHLNVVGASNIGGSVATLLASTAHHLCASMQDLLPDGATNINNVYVDTTTVPGQALFTWLNVPCFGAVAPTSTFQIALIDSGTNDIVEFRYQSLTNNSTSNGGVAITGFSLGGTALNGGSVDFTAGVVSSSVDQPPLRLAGLTRPVTNTNWNLQVSNIPAGGVLGIDIFGISDPAIPDLFFLGMPGCGLRASLDLLNAYLPAGATHAYGFAVPNDPVLTGFQLFTTSAMWVLPAPNAFGVITANGVGGTVGTL